MCEYYLIIKLKKYKLIIVINWLIIVIFTYQTVKCKQSITQNMKLHFISMKICWDNKKKLERVKCKILINIKALFEYKILFLEIHLYNDKKKYRSRKLLFLKKVKIPIQNQFNY